ncbi:MAG TPA: histidine kinase dimerization/phospho-acceptor domain-containing protein, partial [Candidatus Obscuribacterales bacterium]
NLLTTLHDLTLRGLGQWGNLSTAAIQSLVVGTPTAIAARLVAAAPEACWVVVDEQQQYQGILDKTRLLASAFTAIAPDTPTPDGLQGIDQSNTALLTYLGHELKTPLTSLLGLSSLLKIGGLGELSPRQSRYIGLIQQHCRRLAAWVNTLIDLGRIESGTLKLIPEMVALAEVWPEAYRQAALRIGHEETAIPSMADFLQLEDNPQSLIADAPRLKQMLSCLMQTALAVQTAPTPSLSAPPLAIAAWDGWITFFVRGLADSLALDRLAPATFTLPFPTTPIPSTPISAEMGHWLEWLLVRKLAQLHHGDLVLAVHENAEICPTLILPTTPIATAASGSRFLVVVTRLPQDSLAALWQQANQLNYRLLIAQQVKDAIEIARALPISAILVIIQNRQIVDELPDLQAAMTHRDSITIALVPPTWSYLLGELPVDREILWPTDSLGSVLLQPLPSVPSPNRLTILYLKTAEPTQGGRPQKFPHIFHDFGCRVLEVDDLEQASLLRRVWNPDVAVLDPAIAAPGDYLQTFAQFPDLASLPLVTLTMSATRAAHEIDALAVFPCLVEEASWETPESSERLTTWLIQVLQVAATKP